MSKFQVKYGKYSQVIVYTAIIIASIFSTTFLKPAQATEQKISYASFNSSNNEISNSHLIQILQPILVGGIATLSLTALGLGTSFLSGKNKEQSEAQIKTAKEIADAVKVAKINSNRPADLLKSNQTQSDEALKNAVAELIKNYHTQALSQASTQFWFSITAASVGFVLIIYTSFASLRGKTSQSLLNTIPGVAMEAVAALFFKQAEDTRTRATQLYDRLRTDEKEIEGLILIETIENKELRDFVKAKWALQIAGVQSPPTDLSPYLPKANPGS